VGIAGAIVSLDAVIHADVPGQVHPHSEAQALKKDLIYKACPHEEGIKCGEITKVIVIDVERKARRGLDSYGQETPTKPGSRSTQRGRFDKPGLVGLQRMID